MALARCVRCDKIMGGTPSPVCRTCQSAEDADYEKIRRVLVAHLDLSAEKVAEAADVDFAVVRRMLQSGLLAQLNAGETIRCGRCGAPAISMAKKLCPACLDKLNAEASRAQAELRLGAKKAPRLGAGGDSTRQMVDGKRR